MLIFLNTHIGNKLFQFNLESDISRKAFVLKINVNNDNKIIFC